MCAWNEPRSLRNQSSCLIASHVVDSMLRVGKSIPISNGSNREELIQRIKGHIDKLDFFITSYESIFRVSNFYKFLDDFTKIKSSNRQKYILFLLLKLKYLDTVDIDEVFPPNNSRRGTVNHIQPNQKFCTQLFLQLNNFSVKKLTAYLYVHPNILEMILFKCKELKDLILSPFNLSTFMQYDKRVSNLKSLELYDYYPDENNICKSFFGGQNLEYVIKKIDEMETFENSKEHENFKIFDTSNRVCNIENYSSYILKVFKCMLFFYDLEHIRPAGKREREILKRFCQEIILPLAKKGKVFSLNYISITEEFLLNLSTEDFFIVAKSLPKLERIYLHSTTTDLTSSKGIKLAEILNSFLSHFKISEFCSRIQDQNSLSMIGNFIKSSGGTLRELGINCGRIGDGVCLNDILNLIDLCPKLITFKLYIKFTLDCELDENQVLRIPKSFLEEVWIVDCGPHTRKRRRNMPEITYRKNWVLLINAFLQIFPNVTYLSITGTVNLLQIIIDANTIVTNTTIKFLRISFELSGNFAPRNKLIDFIEKFLSLKKIYISPLDSDLFSYIQDYFKNTRLDVISENIY